MSFRSNQKLKLPLTGKVVLNRVPDWSKAKDIAAGLSARRSSAWASGLFASPSSSILRALEGAELREPRGKQLGRDSRVFGRDQPDRQRLQGGRRHDLDGDIADRCRIIAGGDRKMERLIDRLDPTPELAPLQ